MTGKDNLSTWGFQNPVEIRFGPTCIREYAQQTPFKNALLVTTAGMVKRGTISEFIAKWPHTSFTVCDSVTPNPALLDLEQHAANYRDEPFDCIVGIGGGSALDTG